MVLKSRGALLPDRGATQTGFMEKKMKLKKKITLIPWECVGIYSLTMNSTSTKFTQHIRTQEHQRGLDDGSLTQMTQSTSMLG